jgi:hypothetical protein
MKKLSLVPVFVFSLLNAGASQAATYMGASTGVANGAAGAIKLSSLCYATYVSSRMCTVAEVGTAIHAATKAHGPAWVMPTWTPVGGTYFAPYSPESTCAMWTRNEANFFGFTVNGKGNFALRGCDSMLPVACCK